MSCSYAMNLNDGREVFNSEAVATNVNYVEIDDEIHEAMKRGELTWDVVANAVRAKRNNDPNFDWAQYDVLRDRVVHRDQQAERAARIHGGQHERRRRRQLHAEAGGKARVLDQEGRREGVTRCKTGVKQV